MDVFFLLVFATFTALTCRAFILKLRKTEPLPEKKDVCISVAFWSLWLAIISAGAVFGGMEDEIATSVASIGWLIVASANLAIVVYALLVWLAFHCSHEKEKKEGDDAP